MCTDQIYSLAETPDPPPPPACRIWAHILGRYWSAKISLCDPLILDFCMFILSCRPKKRLITSRIYNAFYCILKTRYGDEFRLQVFFMSTPLGPFRIFSKIREDILEWMFIAGVNDTGDKLFTGVNDTGDKSLSRIFSDPGARIYIEVVFIFNTSWKCSFPKTNVFDKR